jgi:hypothetical protein
MCAPLRRTAAQGPSPAHGRPRRALPRKTLPELANPGTRTNVRESPFQVPHSSSCMKPAWILLLAAALTFVTGASGSAPAGGVRFSQSLSAADRAASGLDRLTSDEVAVIDALVRRDNPARNADTPPRFSQRLTADERKIAGFGTLTADELPQLDAFIERYHSAKLARTLLAPPTFLSRHARMQPENAKPEKNVHGSFSLSYGFGKGGYSEKTGSMVVHIDDPQRRFSVSIGYTESHVKGGSLYRDPFLGDSLYRDPLQRDPFYRDSRSHDAFSDSRTRLDSRGVDLRTELTNPLAR